MFIRRSLFIVFASLFVSGILLANEFEIIPSSWTDFKYHCSAGISVSIKNNNPYNYSTFWSVVKFNWSEISVVHNSIDPFFTTMPTGHVDWNLYTTAWWNVVGGTWNRVAANFTLNTVPGIISSSTELIFVDENWDPLTGFNVEDTDDWLTITSTNTVGDTLSGVTNVTYNFVEHPCNDDNAPPSIKDSASALDKYFPVSIHWWRLTWTENISMLVLDWTNSDGHYWYSGNAVSLSNYVATWSYHVDNQYGVNSSTLRVKIENSANGGTTEYITPTSVAYTGNFLPNKYTWNSVDRGYWIDFTNSNSFEVEKEVIITVTWLDNQNYVSSTNEMSETFIFNSPYDPTIGIVTPADNSEFQSTTISPLIFQVDDSWAGIDTGSVIIEIPVVMSGITQLLTGYIYSWSDLSFSNNNWSAWTGNQWWYEISLIPNWDFPSDRLITVSGFVADLVWNTIDDTWTFETRPDCSFYGCNEILDIYIMAWNSYNMSTWHQFTGELLIVTWTNINSPYPYLTGINNDILMCWLPWTWAVLTWSVVIYDTDGITTINGDIYTWNSLYITGADFTYSNWVITVN